MTSSSDHNEAILKMMRARAAGVHPVKAGPVIDPQNPNEPLSRFGVPANDFSHTTQDKDHGQQAKDQGGTEACD